MLVLAVICLFVFFVALGALWPSEVTWLTIAIVVLAALWIAHACGTRATVVRRPLRRPRPRAPRLLAQATRRTSARGSACRGAPNILYLHSHDTGRYVQPYGHQVPTPNIQRLADQGVLFRQAFCAAPTCSGSRAALLTGQYAPHQRHARARAPRLSLHDYRHHIVHTLREAGYWSALIGEQHVSADPHVHRLRPGRRDRHDARRRRRAGRRRAARASAPKQPFFLSVGFFETHREFFAADLGARRALLAAARQPARHARDAPRHGRLQGQRALARPGRRRRARRARRARPRRRHARHPHHRPRARLPGRQGDAHRPRHRRDADHARAGRLPRRPGVRRAGLPHRPLPDDLRARRASSARTGCRAARCCRWCAARPTRSTTRSSRSSPTTPPTSRSARSARERWKYVRRFGDRRLPVLANIDDSPSKDLLLAARLGRPAAAARGAARPRVRPERGAQPRRRRRRTPACSPSCGRAWSAGCARPTTRCSTAPSPPPPGAELNDPDQRSAVRVARAPSPRAPRADQPAPEDRAGPRRRCSPRRARPRTRSPSREARANHRRDRARCAARAEVAEVRDLACPAAGGEIPVRVVPAGGRRAAAAGRLPARRRLGDGQRRHATTRVCGRWPTRRARSWPASTTAWRPSTASRRRSRTRWPRCAGSPRTRRAGRRRLALAVAGDSAGGNLAAVVARRLRGELAARAPGADLPGDRRRLEPAVLPRVRRGLRAHARRACGASGTSTSTAPTAATRTPRRCARPTSRASRRR